MEHNWRRLFTNRDNYYEYVLGYQGYTSLEKYIMCGLSKTEIRCMNFALGLVKTFNQMHAGYRVRVEWGIGGLKMK